MRRTSRHTFVVEDDRQAARHRLRPLLRAALPGRRLRALGRCRSRRPRSRDLRRRDGGGATPVRSPTAAPSPFLETDDHRLPAIAAYLRLGYVPQYTEADHEGRWSAIFTQLADGRRGKR